MFHWYARTCIVLTLLAFMLIRVNQTLLGLIITDPHNGTSISVIITLCSCSLSSRRRFRSYLCDACRPRHCKTTSSQIVQNETKPRDLSDGEPRTKSPHRQPNTGLLPWNNQESLTRCLPRRISPC